MATTKAKQKATKARKTVPAKAKTTKKTVARRVNAAAKSERQIKKVKPYLKNLWVGAYVAAAIIAPQLALLWRPVVGVYVTAAALVALLGLGLRSEQARKLAISAAILPVTLLVSLSLPQSDSFAQAGVFYDTILLLALLYGYTFTLDEPLNVSAMGKRYILALPLMVVMGEVLGAIGYGMLRHVYAFRSVPMATVVTAAVVFAAAEELLFRGLIQQQASKTLHPIAAAVLTVVAYTTVYVAHGSILPAVFALIAGTALSATYYFKQNLVLTTTANALMKLTYLGLVATFVLR